VPCVGGVKVTTVCHDGMTHDFMMLNPLSCCGRPSESVESEVQHAELTVSTAIRSARFANPDKDAELGADSSLPASPSSIWLLGRRS
jgi:hypothetical protein